jgi:hypothetical protein
MKNFVKSPRMGSRNYVYYYKLNEAEAALFKNKRTDLKMSLEYTLGEYNYFSGNKNPRGYKLYFTPVACSGNGFEESMLLGEQFEAGYYVNVEVAERYNAKRLVELAEALDAKLNDPANGFAKLYLEKSTTTMQDFVRWAVNEAPKPKVSATPKPAQKNLCGKTRDVENPYEVWVGSGPLEGWEWRVLKKWQTPDKECNNPYARWFCAVKSPMTYGSWEYGDTYVKDVVGMYTRMVKGKPDLKAVMAERPQVF